MFKLAQSQPGLFNANPDTPINSQTVTPKVVQQQEKILSQHLTLDQLKDELLNPYFHFWQIHQMQQNLQLSSLLSFQSYDQIDNKILLEVIYEVLTFAKDDKQLDDIVSFLTDIHNHNFINQKQQLQASSHFQIPSQHSVKMLEQSNKKPQQQKIPFIELLLRINFEKYPLECLKILVHMSASNIRDVTQSLVEFQPQAQNPEIIKSSIFSQSLQQESSSLEIINNKANHEEFKQLFGEPLSKNKGKGSSEIEKIFKFICDQENQQSMSQEYLLLLKQEFYSLIGNLANETIFGRDAILKIEGLTSIMKQDLKNHRHLVESILWTCKNILQETPFKEKFYLKHIYVDIYLSMQNLCNILSDLNPQETRDYWFPLMKLWCDYYDQLNPTDSVDQDFRDIIRNIFINITYKLKPLPIRHFIQESSFLESLTSKLENTLLNNKTNEILDYLSILQNLTAQQLDMVTYLLSNHFFLFKLLSEYKLYSIPNFQTHMILTMQNIFQIAGFDYIRTLEQMHTEIMQHGVIQEIINILDQGVRNGQIQIIWCACQFLQVVAAKDDDQFQAYLREDPHLGSKWRQQIRELMNEIISKYQQSKKLYSLAIDVLEKDFNENQDAIDLENDEDLYETQYSEYKIQKFFI
eukprot:403330848